MASNNELAAHLSGTPLETEAVEALLRADARELGRDAAGLRVLLLRIRATLAADAEALRTLRGDVARMSESYKVRSSPLAAAVEALDRLDPEDQAQVFTVLASSVLETLRTETARARDARLAATATTRRNALVLARLANDDALPPHLRELVLAEQARATAADASPGSEPVEHQVPQLPALEGPLFRAAADPDPGHVHQQGEQDSGEGTNRSLTDPPAGASWDELFES